MKKYEYCLYQKVKVVTDYYCIIMGTITDIDDSLYKVEYEPGGYDWLLYDEIMPVYEEGDYVYTPKGLGKITDIDDYNGLTVALNNSKDRYYYEYEVKPAYKPSALQKVIDKVVAIL